MKPTWTFDDGTTVELGGRIEGSSDFAKRLRVGVALVGHGDPPEVDVDVLPGGSVPLDLSDASIVDSWLTEEARFHRRVLVGRPEVPARRSHWSTGDFDPNALY
jgi:hypothetical protein